MDFIRDKIKVLTEKLNQLKTINKEKIEYIYICCPEYKKDNTPPEITDAWEKSVPYLRFHGVDKHYWIHTTVKTENISSFMEPRLSVKTGREGMWDSKNPQFTVFINGKTVQALDTNHTWIPLEPNNTYDIYMYLYTGMEGGDFGCEITLDTVDLRIEGLYYDISVPYECMKLIDEGERNYLKIRKCLDNATLLLDLREFYSDNFYKGIEAASIYLEEEFYKKVCSTDSESTLNCIGHTHIDVAYLWTVAQTKEKAQRSFSTVINLMKRYNDYIFFSSQPQLYDFVKQNDPELYEEIKKRIEEGRWEAEGAMWLEADTNLTSGEFLIRQILFGKRFMKNEFGIDNKILWLPDVFGYSAALPQILRKTGITQFFTTKMNWNETNKLPHDVFEWEGIDGSRVFANLIYNYISNLNPLSITKFDNSFKDKDIMNESMMTFGFGDGGGGPTYEMMENYLRLKRGIPGMPKTLMKKASEHLNEAEEKFYANTKEYNRPVWTGEMYLEMHRGTYTSMAKNKRNNRKSELLYQTAETVAVSDMVLFGKEYPSDIIKKNTENILLNQFHDIIPGSSIKEVYDVTDKEYEVIIKEGEAIKNSAIDSIKKGIETDGGIFVYNPTPFMMSDIVNVNGKTYYAEDIPSHGWKVIADKETDKKISVSDYIIENDVIRVGFNDRYHITSVYDKAERREIIPAGTESNRFEIFEDYPRAYDAWEITDYYKQKMWIADDVSEIEKLANGIKITRKYGKSTFIQEITLTPESKRIDFNTVVDWHEDHVLLKTAFPVDIRNTNATYDIQFGNISRPTHENTSWDKAKFEVCAHKWADISESNYGVSIINDCKYGYSISGNVMKLSLLKAATYPNPEADRGIHKFVYSLYPHKGCLKDSDTVKQGYLLNMPFESSVINKNKGDISSNFSLIHSDNDAVVIETVKKAEDENSVVVRMYEAYNGKEEFSVITGFDFKEAYICDMLENNEKLISHNGRIIPLKINNFEILTLKIKI